MLAFRQATTDDVPDLQELAETTWHQFEGKLGEDTWKLLSNALQKVDYTALVNETYGVLCEDKNPIDHKSHIVGMAFLVPRGNPTQIFPAAWCYVRMVTVRESHNGQGIGRELMRRCIEEARAQGETTIGLHTSEFMNAARHIYESIGFKVAWELEPRFGKKYWVYQLDL